LTECGSSDLKVAPLKKMSVN